MRDRFPRRMSLLLSGEGAVGKSITLLQLAAAHVLGRDWLRSMPEPGPVLLVNCEDEGDELVRRLDPILKSHHAKFSDIAADLHVFSLADQDPLLALPIAWPAGASADAALHQIAGTGEGSAADLHRDRQRRRRVRRQRDRPQPGPAIRRLDEADRHRGERLRHHVGHPSLAGITSKSGLSGSTQWHNSVRARAYMHMRTTTGAAPAPACWNS